MAKKRLTKEEIIKRNRRIRRKFVGAVFVIFALIGVGTVITLGARGIIKMLDDTDEKIAYEKLYTSVAALDPAPFDISTAAPNELLLEASIWATIQNEGTGKYARDENGALLLPAVDVATYAKKMFSSAYKIEHKTFSDVDIQFIYDITTDMYTLPLTSLEGIFELDVLTMTTAGGTRILSVAYMFTGDYGETSETPVKYMEYVLIKEDGEYRLSAIREPELEVTPQN